MFGRWLTILMKSGGLVMPWLRSSRFGTALALLDLMDQFRQVRTLMSSDIVHILRALPCHMHLHSASPAARCMFESLLVLRTNAPRGKTHIYALVRPKAISWVVRGGPETNSGRRQRLFDDADLPRTLFSCVSLSPHPFPPRSASPSRIRTPLLCPGATQCKIGDY